MKLLVDLDRSGFEVHAVPGQPQGLRFPQAGEENGFQDDLQLIIGRRLEERFYLLVCQRGQLLLFHLRERDPVGGVHTQITNIDCGRERLRQGPVNVSDRLCGHGGGFIHDLPILFDELSGFIPFRDLTAACQQLIVEPLDQVRDQL